MGYPRMEPLILMRCKVSEKAEPKGRTRLVMKLLNNKQPYTICV